MSSAYPDLHDLCAPWYSIGLDGLDISKCKVASFGHWCCHPGANCSIRVWFRISSCHLDHLVLQAKGFPSIGLYAISMHIFACFCKFFFSASFDLWRHLGRKILHHDDQVVAWMQFLRRWLHDHYSTSCNPLKRPETLATKTTRHGVKRRWTQRQDKHAALLVFVQHTSRFTSWFQTLSKRRRETAVQGWKTMKNRNLYKPPALRKERLFEPHRCNTWLTTHWTDLQSGIVTVKQARVSQTQERSLPRLPDSPNTLPANASHTVGVGALVTNSEATWTAILQIFEISMQCDVLQLVAKMTSLSNKPCKTGQGKILLVREKSGPAAKFGFWKIPTGLVDAGEVTLQQRGNQFSDDSHSVATLSFL